jgi:serine/threonine-protein kinase
LAARVGAEVGGKWTLEAVVGVGGMAAVYRARHRNGHQVAIKILHSELLLHPNLVERFLREGYVANKIRHPAVVPVVDDGTLPDGSPYLVMDFLDGEALDLHVGAPGRPARRPPFSEAEAANLFGTIADVLILAEQERLIHRDIKPANIFQKNDGSIVLLDFGIALIEAEPIEGATGTGISVGTPGYMAPEQARARKDLVGPSSDRFALAATVLTLLAGRKLRGANTHAEEFALAIMQPFPAAASLGLAIRPAFAAVLDRALAFDIASRHPTGRAMRTEFDLAMAETRPSPRAAAGPQLDGPAAARPPSGEDTSTDAAARPPGTAVGEETASRSPLKWPLVVAGLAVVSAATLGGALALRRSPVTVAPAASGNESLASTRSLPPERPEAPSAAPAPAPLRPLASVATAPASTPTRVLAPKPATARPPHSSPPPGSPLDEFR